MSVRIEKPSDFTPARIRRPSRSPGPRYASPLVRFALSNEALNTKSPTSSRMEHAMRRTCSSLSITHGPAMRTSGRGAPWARPKALKSKGTRVLGLRGLHSRIGAANAVFVGRADEGLEQRMRLHGFGFEFRMELAAQEPGVIGDLANFNVGAVRRFAR